MHSSLKILFILILAQLYVQCASNKNDRTDLEIVDMAGAYKQQKQSSAGMSFFSENDIEYIQLKTPEKNSINEDYLRVYADADHIILVGFRQMFVFDRKSGEFIREIGKFGKGPNEYGATCHHNAYDYSRKIIIAYQWNKKKYFEYNVKGEVIANLNFTSPEVGDFSGQINHLENKTYVVYYNNYQINNRQRLNLIDTGCNVLKTYYHNKGEGEPKAITTGLSNFYKYQDELMFSEMFCDTLFHVTKENLTPRFVFGLGEFHPPYEKLFDSNYFRSGESNNHFHINKLFESARYLFIRFSYDEYWFWHAVYDKKTKTTTMQKDESGIENDINRFIPLRYATSVNNEDELIGFIEAYNVADWFRSNSEKAAKLPDSLKKFQSMTTSDPPLIMIMKLKQ